MRNLEFLGVDQEMSYSTPGRFISFILPLKIIHFFPEKSAKLMANMNGNEVLLNCTVALGDSAEDEIVWTRDGKTIDLNDTSSEFSFSFHFFGRN